MRVSCRFCGERIDADSPGVYQYVKGWERRRKGGGTHAIRLPERLRMWACHACIDAQVKGYAEEPTLW